MFPRVTCLVLTSQSKYFIRSIVTNAKKMPKKSTSNPIGKAPPAAIDVLVVAGGRRDTSNCILVNTDYSTYLFNCPEGAQRILTDIGGSKFSRLEHIFMTTNRWQNGGGLLGMALTLQTAAVKRLAIHGPPNCDKILTLARSFTSERDELYLDIEPCVTNETKDCDTLFSDDSLTVYSVPLVPELNPSGNSPKRPRQSPTFGGDTALAYILKPKPKNRRVDMNKCIQLGLPRGPTIGQLVRGETVTLPDGRVITPDQVLDDPQPARPVLIIECPTDSYVKSLAENPVISKLTSSPEVEEHAQLLVHMSPAHVFESKAYKSWLSNFKNAELSDHLILNENCSHIAHERIYRIQAQLNALDPKMFKLLNDQLPENIGKSNQTPLIGEGQSNGRWVQAGTGLTYLCRQGQFQAAVKGFPIQLDNNEFISEIKNSAVEESLANYRKLTEKLNGNDLSSPSTPNVLFLGTASAVPGKRRNSSAILLQLHRNDTIRHVLMDCAEGTAGQLLRYFGLGEEADKALASLDLVLLTHRHADHHMGLLGLIYERMKAFRNLEMEYRPLMVVFPKYQIGNWLKAYASTLDPRVFTHLIQTAEAERIGEASYVNDHFHKCIADLGLKRVESVPVRHCKFAVGYHVTTADRFRLVYSGDTMPSDLLVQAGRGCDVLIHEATFDDDLGDEAVSKRHSTTSQALEIGRRMGAKLTLLTHFSQRYETLPYLSEEMLQSPPKHNVGIAFDNMLISTSDENLARLPHMIPVLSKMFAEKLEALDEIKQKRNLKRERELTKLTSMLPDATSS